MISWWRITKIWWPLMKFRIVLQILRVPRTSEVCVCYFLFLIYIFVINNFTFHIQLAGPDRPWQKLCGGGGCSG